jgi:DNA (cytosine-5)-methyltransferase 1
MMTHLSLFSGIGGLDLAAEWAGFETVGQCEWADYPTKVLEKHWPDVPRWRDIRTLTGDDFYAKTGRRTVDVISGGFPCQPFSVAGKQKGKRDDRYLWPEMLRVIRELTPAWVIGENVPGILRIAAEEVLSDLESAGYRAAILNYEAAAAGAWHRRDRVFFVANRDLYGQPPSKEQGGANQGDGRETWEEDAKQPKGLRTSGKYEAVGDAESIGRERNRADRECIGRASAEERAIAGCCALCNETGKPERSDWRAVESGMGGMADGIPHWLDGEPAGIPRIIRGMKHRADRIKALGNAVVPQQAYPIFRAIRMIEEES